MAPVKEPGAADANSRNVADNRGSHFSCYRGRQSPPNPRPPSERAVIRRGGGAPIRGCETVPPKLLVAPAPLRLESMGSGATRAPPEVESFHAFRNRPLHERPVDQHVRGFAVVLAERG